MGSGHISDKRPPAVDESTTARAGAFATSSLGQDRSGSRSGLCAVDCVMEVSANSALPGHAHGAPGSTKTAPNRHGFETEIWRLNNAITKCYKELEKYWNDERRVESTALKTDEAVLKQGFLVHKERTKELEAELKNAQAQLQAKQRTLRDLEDADLAYKDPQRAKAKLAELEKRYKEQRFSSAREEQLIINEIERHRRNVNKLVRYTPVLADFKKLEAVCKETRTQHREQKRLLWDTRDRWQAARQKLRRLREPAFRMRNQLRELKAQKKVLVAKYEQERNNYTLWMKTHRSQGTLSSFPVALLHDNHDELEPFHEKKRVCHRLISYLNQLAAISSEPELSKEVLAEVTEAAAQVCARRKPQLSLDSEDSADDFPVSFQHLHMKQSPDVCPTANKRKFNTQKPKKQSMPITHDIDHYRLFSDLNVLPPKTYADVEDTLQKVQKILEFYEEQTDLAASEDGDVCLSPIPSLVSMSGSEMFDSPLLSPHSASSASLLPAERSESAEGSPEVVSRTNSTNRFTNVDSTRNSM